MAIFVIVHGAWSGGWSWTPVARLLRAEGHEAHVVSLTGLGERWHLLRADINLSTHISDVVNLITAEGLSDVILAGHSYGGMVITGASAVIGSKIRSLVYLDAWLPDDGQSLWDLADEESRAFYVANQRGSPGLVAFPGPPPGVELPPGSTLERIRAAPPWVIGRHPFLTLTEPVKLGGEEGKVLHRTYVLTTKPPTFQRFYDKAHAAGWKTTTIGVTHLVNQEDPKGIAALLLEEVGR